MRAIPLTCYRVRSVVGGSKVTDPDDVLDLGERDVTRYGPIRGRNFTAHLFVVDAYPHEPAWGPFLRSGFGDDVSLPRGASPAALLLVDIGKRSPKLFAFTFGVGGRHLLRDDAYERGYGLRTALNILYPRTADEVTDDLARLRAMESKRRGATVVRSRSQASQASTFETFDINRLRDVVNAAMGIPADHEVWGPRVGGADYLSLAVATEFDQLGDLCQRVETQHGLDAYKEHFAWIDFIQPVSDPWTIATLEREVVLRLVERRLDGLSLAPPEIVDWERAARFRYPYDRGRGRKEPVAHFDLRVEDLVTGLSGHGLLDDVGVAYLRNQRVEAVDAGGEVIHEWPIWRCLVAELVLGTQTFILDEGQFFVISSDYLKELDEFIGGIPASTLALPPGTPLMWEKEYNKLAARDRADLLLMDAKLIRTNSATTPVELCDLLSTSRQLVHIKRHLGSSDLSHLFAQGVTSAELLQYSAEFRIAAQAKVTEQAAGRDGFDLFQEHSLTTGDFEVIYGVVERWAGRSTVEALPFFSKVNLREAATNLWSRGYRLGFAQIAAD